MTNRDTHFYNAATFLYEKLAKNVMDSEKGLSDVEAFKQEQYTIIAQFAYDLTMYNLKSFIDGVFGGTALYDPEEIIRDYIPDLTQWPTKDELQ